VGIGRAAVTNLPGAARLRRLTIGAQVINLPHSVRGREITVQSVQSEQVQQEETKHE